MAFPPPHEAKVGDARGAVFVEKLIVYLPLLLTFFLTWELAELAAAQLVVQRASAAAGRAAVVVLADDPAFYDGEQVGSFGGRRRDDIELAAGMVLSAIPRLTSDFALDVSEPPEGFGAIEVSLTSRYDCGTVSVMCGGDGSIELSSSTTHVYQGARYTYATPTELGGGSAALASTHGDRQRSRSRASEPDIGSTSQAVAKPKPPNDNQSNACNATFNQCTSGHGLDKYPGLKNVFNGTAPPQPTGKKCSVPYGADGTASDKALELRCKKQWGPGATVNISVIKYKCPGDKSKFFVRPSGAANAPGKGKGKGKDKEWTHSEQNSYKAFRAEFGKECEIEEFYTERESCLECQKWYENNGTNDDKTQGPIDSTLYDPGEVTGLKDKTCYHFLYNGDYGDFDPTKCSANSGCSNNADVKTMLGLKAKCTAFNKPINSSKANGGEPGFPHDGSCSQAQAWANRNKDELSPAQYKDMQDCLEYKKILDDAKKLGNKGQGKRDMEAAIDLSPATCAKYEKKTDGQPPTKKPKPNP